MGVSLYFLWKTHTRPAPAVASAGTGMATPIQFHGPPGAYPGAPGVPPQQIAMQVPPDNAMAGKPVVSV